VCRWLHFAGLSQDIQVGLICCSAGLQILGKAEFLNPGGSVKDRVAVKIIEEVIFANCWR
jgi:cysteine synthase A